VWGGFGLYEPAFGVSWHGGLPDRSNADMADLRAVNAGIMLPFLSTSPFDVSLYADMSVIHGTAEYPCKAGLEARIIDSFWLRAGFTAPQSYDYADVTFGLGYEFKSENYIIGFDYAVVHYSRSSWVHSAGVRYAPGGEDILAPKIRVTPRQVWISPDNDGVQDSLLLDVYISDRSPLRSWTLQIFDAGGRLIREYKQDERLDRPFSLARELRHFWGRREFQLMPPVLEWDCTDSTGRTVADGMYHYSLVVSDAHHNYSWKRGGRVIIDTVAPSAELKIEQGRIDTARGLENAVLTQKVDADAQDTWRGTIANERGSVIRSWSWTTADLSASLVWDGQDDSGQAVAEGRYQLFAGRARCCRKCGAPDYTEHCGCP
jgi:hypothetical protein